MKKTLRSFSKVTWYAFATAMLFTGLAQAQTPVPATITSGFNHDIIANGVGNATTSSTIGFDEKNSIALVSADFKATATSAAPQYSLPTSGLITSAVTSGVTFQLANYTGSNALFLTPAYVATGTASGTLAFSASNVGTIYILAAGANGGAATAPLTAVINFSSGTPQTAALTVNDWYNGTGFAAKGIGRVRRLTNVLEVDAENPRLYEIAIPLDAANQTKTITGITFTYAGAPTAEYFIEARASVLAVTTRSSIIPATSVVVATQNSAPATITTDKGTLQLGATIAPATASQNVTWAITTGSTLATVSATGLVTAKANGTVTVVATSVNSPTISGSFTVTITNQLRPSSGPVAITSGFNYDIIANGVGNASASSTMGFDQQNSIALVSADFKATATSTAPTYALPANGTIASAATTGVTFQLANYTGNNALFLTPTYVGTGVATGTINFSAANVGTIYVLGAAAGGGAASSPLTASVKFSDGSSQDADLSLNDWYDGTGYAIQGIGRVRRATNVIEGSATNPRLYQMAITVAAANYNKTITGIAFTYAGASTAEYANEARASILAISLATAPAVTTVATQNNVAPTIITDKGTLQLVATLTPASATNTFTWSITTGAANATVSATGLVTAINNGTVNVRATASNASFADILVTITNQVVAVTGVTVTVKDAAPATITTNAGTLALVATVAPANATNKAVTWAITTGSEFATISADGVVTAKANGTVVVTATTTDGAKTGTISIVITNQIVVVTGVTVTVKDNAAATITTNGGTLALVATVAPADATNKNVTWAITTGSEFATIDEAGVVTAKANGTVVVTANTADGAKTGTISVIITGQIVAVTGVTVSVKDDAEATITTKDGTLQLVATVAPVEATNADVTWAVTTGTEFATIDEDGLVTAVKNGTATITATTADGSFTDTIDVVIDIKTAGVNDVSLNNFTAYPNPTTGLVTINAAQNVNAFMVYNTLGQLVKAGKGNSVNLESAQQGVYMLQVQFENGTTKTLKIIRK